MLNKIIQTFFSKALLGVFSLLTVILTSNFLGAEGRGTTSLILTSITIILVVCNMVGGPVLVYLAPRVPVGDLLLPSTLWAVALSIAGTFVLSLLHLLDAAYIPHIFILTLLNALYYNNMMLLLGKENVRAFNMLNMLQSFIIVATVAFCFYIRNYYEVWAYVIALYVSFITITLLSTALVYKHIQTPNLQTFSATFKKMLNYGMLVQLAAAFTLITYRLGYYMIENYRGRAEVGVFSVGVSLSEAIWLVAGSFGLILFSKVANLDDRRASQLMTLHLVRVVGVITFIVLLPLILCPASFFPFIFGTGFEQVHTIVLWLAPGILLYSVNIVLTPYFSGTAQYHITTLGAAVGFVVIIVFNLLLIPRFGIEGAAVASSLAYGSMALYQVIMFKKQSGCRFIDFIVRKEDFLQAIGEMKNLFSSS